MKGMSRGLLAVAWVSPMLGSRHWQVPLSCKVRLQVAERLNKCSLQQWPSKAAWSKGLAGEKSDWGCREGNSKAVCRAQVFRVEQAGTWAEFWHWHLPGTGRIFTASTLQFSGASSELAPQPTAPYGGAGTQGTHMLSSKIRKCPGSLHCDCSASHNPEEDTAVAGATAIGQSAGKP